MSIKIKLPFTSTQPAPGTASLTWCVMLVQGHSTSSKLVPIENHLRLPISLQL